MSVKFVGVILVLMDAHLQEPFYRTKELDIVAIVDGIFELSLNGIVVANVEHIVDKEKDMEPLVVLVVADKIGQFGLGLMKVLGVEPFREFNVPIFSGIDQTVDSFVK